MVNKIDDCFARLRSDKRKGFIPYICAGDPSLQDTVDLALALEESGADILELGLPFSDPLADGIVNQLAAQRALTAGATARGVLDCVRQIRARSTIPIVLYTYLNPILQFGFEKFDDEAQAAGIDGLLILDLPPEEDATSFELDGLKPSSLTSARKAAGYGKKLLHIRLVAPTTPPGRMAAIAQNAKGFLYYVSREGVTGTRDDVAATLADQVQQLRKFSELPIAVGFGISNPQQAREVAQHADAIVVGSAIVDLIAKHGRASVKQVGALARSIAAAIR